MFHNRLCFHFRLADLCRKLCAIIQVLIVAEILVHHRINKVINFSNSNYWWLLTEIFTLVLSNITQKGYPGWWKVQSKFPCNLSNWKQQDIKHNYYSWRLIFTFNSIFSPLVVWFAFNWKKNQIYHSKTKAVGEKSKNFIENC